MQQIKILFFIVTLFTLTGCKKYLEFEPTRQTVISTADQLEALVNNAPQFAFDGGNFGWTDGAGAFSTDDTEIPIDAFKANITRWGLDDLYHYTFKTDEIIGTSADNFWNGEYRKIFTANLILSNLDNVSGDEALKNELRADAHFIRGYAYWVLVNHYCLPFTQSNKEVAGLGLPLKFTTDYEEPVNRATLKQTYDLIEADLKEAFKTTRDDVDRTKPWRVSKKAVEAFMSRYYLFLGNYDESLVHTNNALSSTNTKLIDWHTIVAGTPNVYTNPAVTIVNSEMHSYTTFKMLTWGEFYYPHFSYHRAQWFIPSANLRSLFDVSNDLRYKWLFLANSNRRASITSHNLFRYNFFQDGSYIPTGPSIAEMLLNKAEILARKGDVTGAMQNVNALRITRMNTAAPLTATDQADALRKVFQERRREFPFVFRWYDIRRFSVNDDPADDVTITHTFFKLSTGSVDTTSVQTYTLAPGSKRYAVPINGIEINGSKGVIQQNQY